MGRKNVAAIVTLVVAPVFVFAFLVSANMQNEQQPKIGVVNLTTCFEKCDAFKKYQDEINKLIENSKKELKEIEDKISEVSKLLDELKGTSKLKEEKEGEYKKLVADYKMMGENSNTKISNLYQESQTKIYDDILNAIKKVANEKNIDLVLKTEDFPPDKNNKPNISLIIAIRQVLSYDKKMDITDAVIKELNKKDAKKN